MHLSKEAIGCRLQEERKRIGLNQDVFAREVGLGKRTLAGYEGGTGEIGAVALALAAELGVDVLYVVTGERKPQAADSINAAEAKVLECYRALPAADQGVLERTAAVLAEAAGRSKTTE
ncbi:MULTISPECIES: transcriptional regulator [unclassified Pseudomonas]|uniref:transcriptional regulator n=1 Tax=unclassified Pseudomonas TaxID=196821 RepID=UPI00244AF57C|nr:MULTISPECIES: transcriptional regulator [unclassified Pseudomonas]MDH0894671.1 helix-turn-helix domain-containing protein [Pseudomonas sp. GD03875]MDH1067279.1 helix-turn-helix domain-containing protein [Pseudomonas sp. GD03985]